jgi:hypothetical protein
MHSIKRPLSQCGRRHSPRTTAASAVPVPEQKQPCLAPPVSRRLSRIPRQFGEPLPQSHPHRSSSQLEDENAARADA